MNFKRKIAAVIMAGVVGVTAMPVTSFAEAVRTDTLTVEYNATVSKPSYMIKGSKGVRKVKLSCSTSGVTIYYTTNGSKPTTNSKKYGGGLIVFKKDATLRAIAVKNGSVSAVMTKNIDVSTVKGDVTGNGKVDKTDLARFENYRDGKSTYICKDNCDMNGDGKVTTKDISLLKNYLSGDSNVEYEEDDASSSVEKPVMTVYRVYGGKSVKLECDTSGAVIYYTTNGTTPDKSDKKYTSKFVLDDDATVKAVAYKDGHYSSVKTRSITVDQCATPVADKSVDTEYNESVKVALSCGTANSRIVYTTDGTDPERYGKIYNEPIELTENTTLKFCSEAKGYTNSKVVTCNYKVKSSNYTISGRVWDDSMVSEANGVYQSGEAGINDITVMLLNTETNKYEQTTTTSTINGVAGCYQFAKAKPNNKYKIVFQFNGQKYRAFDSVVAGGNQAVSTSFPAITIKNGGAYSQTGTALTNVNNYTNAVTNSYFATWATTNNEYTSAAENVNLALRSNVYGNIELAFSDAKVVPAATGKEVEIKDNGKVYSNDVLSYTLTLSNKSENQILNSSELRLYVPQSLSLSEIKGLDGTNISYVSEGANNSGYNVYLVTCPKLLIKEDAKMKVTAKVLANVKSGASATCYAETVSYAFSSSCYDKNSIPGNFGGTVKEKDEAATVKLNAYTDSTASQSISWTNGNNYSAIPVTTSRVLKFKITNGTSLSDFNVYISDKKVVSCIPTFTTSSTGIDCMLVLTGESVGTSNIVVTLSKDSSKYIDTTITVA